MADFPWGKVLFLLLLTAAMGAMVIVPQLRRRHHGYQGAMEHLLDNLTNAAKCYELDHGVYPPGDGTGTADLARVLLSPGARGVPYFEFRPDMLDAKGNVRSIIPSGENIVRYRSPGIHNRTSFDLWCPDAYGNPEGCNNWD